MKCAAHLEVETNLRCGKCGKPICPRCLVQTPVGAKCPDCAKLYKLPTYRVSSRYYLRAVGAALGMAIVCGVVWGVVGLFVPFFYLNFILAAGVGYVTGEVIGLSVNRKRGKGLAAVAGLGVVISYLISILLPLLLPLGLFNFGLFHIVLDLLAVALGVFVAVTRLR